MANILSDKEFADLLLKYADQELAELLYQNAPPPVAQQEYDPDDEPVEWQEAKQQEENAPDVHMDFEEIEQPGVPDCDLASVQAMKDVADGWKTYVYGDNANAAAPYVRVAETEAQLETIVQNVVAKYNAMCPFLIWRHDSRHANEYPDFARIVKFLWTEHNPPAAPPVKKYKNAEHRYNTHKYVLRNTLLPIVEFPVGSCCYYRIDQLSKQLNDDGPPEWYGEWAYHPRNIVCAYRDVVQYGPEIPLQLLVDPARTHPLVHRPAGRADLHVVLDVFEPVNGDNPFIRCSPRHFVLHTYADPATNVVVFEDCAARQTALHNQNAVIAERLRGSNINQSVEEFAVFPSEARTNHHNSSHREYAPAVNLDPKTARCQPQYSMAYQVEPHYEHVRHFEDVQGQVNTIALSWLVVSDQNIVTHRMPMLKKRVYEHLEQKKLIHTPRHAAAAGTQPSVEKIQINQSTYVWLSTCGKTSGLVKHAATPGATLYWLE